MLDKLEPCAAHDMMGYKWQYLNHSASSLKDRKVLLFAETPELSCENIIDLTGNYAEVTCFQ